MIYLAQFELLLYNVTFNSILDKVVRGCVKDERIDVITEYSS